MINYRDVIIDPSGSPIDDVDVEVRYYSNPDVKAPVFKKNGQPLQDSRMKTNKMGEFEFWIPNGRYILFVYHPEFNNGMPKQVEISVFDPESANFLQLLQNTVLDQAGLILMDRMPFRIFVCPNFNDKPETRVNDVVIALDTRIKYLRTAIGGSNDWAVLDVITRVAGRTGDIVLSHGDIVDFDDSVKSLGDVPNGIARVDENIKISPDILPDGCNVSRLVDEITGDVYRLVVNNGELVLRPVS